MRRGALDASRGERISGAQSIVLCSFLQTKIRAPIGRLILVPDRFAEAYRPQYQRGCLLDALERLRQRLAVASIQVDVVARSVSDLKADSLSNDERDGFGFELPRVARVRPIEVAMEQFVRELVGQHGELRRWREAVEHP